MAADMAGVMPVPAAPSAPAAVSAPAPEPEPAAVPAPAPAPAPEPAPAAAPSPAPSAEEFDGAAATRKAKRLKVAELRAALEASGQPTDGTKPVLVERLVAAQRAVSLL